ncbi:MAG: hypothetical protein WB782_08825 [Thermoplasmata archaeon]
MDAAAGSGVSAAGWSAGGGVARLRRRGAGGGESDAPMAGAAIDDWVFAGGSAGAVAGSSAGAVGFGAAAGVTVRAGAEGAAAGPVGAARWGLLVGAAFVGGVEAPRWAGFGGAGATFLEGVMVGDGGGLLAGVLAFVTIAGLGGGGPAGLGATFACELFAAGAASTAWAGSGDGNEGSGGGGREGVATGAAT